MDIKGTAETYLLDAFAKKAETSVTNGETDAAKLKKACSDFEGILLNTMYQAMKKTVGDSGLFGDGFQKDMYDSLFMEKITGQIAEERGMGIGDALYRQLSAKADALKSPTAEKDQTS